MASETWRADRCSFVIAFSLALGAEYAEAAQGVRGHLGVAV